jgi:hypothetical protein
MTAQNTKKKTVQSIDWKGLIKETISLDGLRKTVATKDKSLSYRYAGILCDKMKEKGETLTSAKKWFMPQIVKAMTASQRDTKQGTIRSQLARASILVPYLESGVKLKEDPTMDQCRTVHKWTDLPIDEIRGGQFKEDFNFLKDEVTPLVVASLATALGGVEKVGVPDEKLVWDEMARFVAQPRETASPLDKAKEAYQVYAEAYGKLNTEERALFEQYKASSRLLS